MNDWWLGPFQLTAWGENWHQNHHTHAGSARLGLRWYQTDIGWYFIWMLEAGGPAHSGKPPRAREPGGRPRGPLAVKLKNRLQPRLLPFMYTQKFNVHVAIARQTR